MATWLRLLIIVIIIFNVSSFVWLLLGSTAYFQREMDIVGTFYLLIVGIPVLLLAILFTVFLIKGTVPTNGVHYIGICLGLILSLILSAILIHGVNSSGWAKEKLESDSPKITADGKYEYHIDLINLFQRNSKARLYLRNVSTGEEKFIPINIQTRKIKTLAVGKVNHWVLLEPTDIDSQYILYTTKDLGRLPEEKFKIDILAGTSSGVK
ncbi:hypothetical protein [Paenibacillus xylanivorans]|uniref:Uncharacterized protein n=1 Tax=Paenibacillus xylanivorans TaxID=1705561 RepID=A0A0M9BNP6_9BACL|nr:hypothetical protein [Paenibacillus xylanivorans]KOY15903.1 hypothetical protein AMS66_14855 [Paenibacillus xylanivorans]